GGIVGRHGRLLADRDMVARFALNMVCNGQGSRLVGTWIEPIIRTAAAREGYRFLPVQAKSIFLNVKGSSAAGK
ncbi:MAG: hypothetical protein KDJ81_01665, partial [Rhodobacteraceae bacterium]|nr:hypothetical protein [Paracoccaceae bacterium]